MTRPRKKIETPEKKSSRAESVPGPGKERSEKNAEEKFEDAASVFVHARDERLRAELELQSLKQSLAFNTKRKATAAQQAKLESALTRVREAKEEEERSAKKAMRAFSGEVPKEMEHLSADEALQLFFQSEDELRAAKQELQNTAPVVKDKKEQKERTAKLHELADAVKKLEKKNERLRVATMHIEMKESLSIPDDGIDTRATETEGGSETSERSKELKVRIADYASRVEKAENEIDSLKEEGASDIVIQERVLALAELKEEKAELETEFEESGERAVAGAKIAEGFDRVLAEAKKDALLAPVAEEYSRLDVDRKKMETRIKKLTGHAAEDILVDPSLAGGAIKRMGMRLKSFFTKVAGMEAEPHADDVMREWKAVNRRMEEIAQTLQPTIDYGHMSRAEAKRTAADEATEVQRALDREEATRRETMKGQKDMEYLGEAELFMNDVKHELSEIELYDDFEQFIEHQTAHQENIETLKERLSLLESHETRDEAYRKRFTEAEELLKTLEERFKAKLAAYQEEIQTAGKGERVMSKVMGRAFGTERTRTAFGTEHASAKHKRVEHFEKEGLKTELSPGPDEYMEEIREYRQEKAKEIRVAMREYEPAAELWERMNEVMEGLLDPDEYERISSILGTRDLATAYVLDVAFASMDGDEAARERVKKVNKILLLADDANIETAAIKKKEKEKKIGGRKRKSKKKKAA